MDLLRSPTTCANASTIRSMATTAKRNLHPIFGRLLARQFAEMWEHLGRPPEFTLVEAGAGVGRLADQILSFCESKLPDFYGALRYVAIERSAARREQAATRSKRHGATGHFAVSAEIPARIFTGCLFSNELLDALPIHRVAMDGGTLKEILVGFSDNHFMDFVAPLTTCAKA